MRVRETFPSLACSTPCIALPQSSRRDLCRCASVSVQSICPFQDLNSLGDDDRGGGERCLSADCAPSEGRKIDGYPSTMSEGEEEGTSPSSRRSSEASEHAPPYMTRMQRFLAATRARFAIFTEPHAPQPAFPGQGRARGSWGSPGSPTAEMVLEDCDACDEDCPICLGTLESGVVQTPCKHKFHRECIERYFLGAREPGAKARCPICRGAVHAPLPIEASSRSGLPIEVVGLPAVGSAVHFDRRYAAPVVKP